MDEEKLNDELTEVTDKSETDEIELDEKSGKMNNFKKKFSGTSKTKKIIALILVYNFPTMVRNAICTWVSLQRILVQGEPLFSRFRHPQ